MKLRAKFTLAFVLCGLVPLVLATLFTHGTVRHAFMSMGEEARAALQEEAENRLLALLESRRYQLETYADSFRAEALVMTRVRFFGQMFMQFREGARHLRDEAGITPEELAHQREVLRAYYTGPFADRFEQEHGGLSVDLGPWVDSMDDDAVALQYGFTTDLPLDEAEAARRDAALAKTSYAEIRALGGHFWERAMAKLGFHDLLLVEAESGRVIYNRAGGIELGQSLHEPPLSRTGVGQAFHLAMTTRNDGEPLFVDVGPYLPALEPSAFMAVRVESPFGPLGAAIFRFGSDRLDEIVCSTRGLGETGETLLIGRDYLLRSDSVRDTTGKFTVRTSFLHPEDLRIDIAPARAALERRETGLMVTKDHLQRDALIAYAPVDMLGTPWAVLVKQDTAEAFASMEDIAASAHEFTDGMVLLSDVVVGVALVVLLFGAYGMSRRIVRPLRRQVDIMRGFAEGEGDLKARICTDAPGEVGEMARWFNAFMDKVEGLYAALEAEVHQRERAQAEIAEQERWYRALIENAPDVIAVIDRESRAHYLSPSFERTFGYPIQEVLGTDMRSYLHPDDQAAIAREREEGLFADRVPVRRERQVRHRDGHWLDVETIVTPHGDAPDMGWGVLNMRDITAQKRAAEEIARLASFPRENPNPVMACGADGTLVYMNPATEELAARQGVETAALLPVHHAATAAQCIETGDGCEVEYTCGESTFLVRYHPVETSNLVHIYLRDISARKRAEQVLRDYSATLERDVAERTVELRRKSDDLQAALEDLRNTQDQLIMNEKMASLGGLTAGIAHEIKNPLNFVNNFAELSVEITDELEEELQARSANLPPEVRGLVEELLGGLRQNAQKIQEHGARADSIVQSMLLHSRGVAGVRSETDVNAMLDEYVRLAYHGMRGRDRLFNIAIEEDYAENLPLVEVVPQDVSRALLNILNNACYAATHRVNPPPDHQPALFVSSREAGDSVEIRIRDNGDGIPPEDRDSIFVPFYTTKPAGEGTGLGLSISYDIIVQEHGGSLQVESEPGEFTEFVVRLPKQAVPRTNALNMGNPRGSTLEP